MTEPYGYDDTETGDNETADEPTVTLTRAQIRTLERDAKKTRSAEAEVASMRQELALSKAGLSDLSPARQKALLASIDGDLTADSAQAAAVELGFVAPPPDSTQDAEQASLNRMSQASAGATDPSSEDSVARLERVAREGGKEALLAQIVADGNVVRSSG